MCSRRIIAVTIAAAVLIVSGHALSAAGEDACAILTQAAVNAALGVQVAAGAPLMPTSKSTCGWAPANDTTHQGKRVVLEIFSQIGRQTPVDRFNTAKSTTVKGIEKTPLAGVGDDAYYATTPGFGTGLTVKKGSSVFQVRVYGFPVDQIKEKEKSLAQTALAKF